MSSGSVAQMQMTESDCIHPQWEICLCLTWDCFPIALSTKDQHSSSSSDVQTLMQILKDKECLAITGMLQQAGRRCNAVKYSGLQHSLTTLSNTAVPVTCWGFPSCKLPKHTNFKQFSHYVISSHVTISFSLSKHPNKSGFRKTLWLNHCDSFLVLFLHLSCQT